MEMGGFGALREFHGAYFGGSYIQPHRRQHCLLLTFANLRSSVTIPCPLYWTWKGPSADCSCQDCSSSHAAKIRYSYKQIRAHGFMYESEQCAFFLQMKTYSRFVVHEREKINLETGAYVDHKMNSLLTKHKHYPNCHGMNGETER